MQKIGRSVERIYIPRGLAGHMSAGFLGNDSQVGGALAQQFDDGGFRFAVGLRHQIVARFFINDEIVPAVEMRLQDRRRGMCGGNGGIKRSEEHTSELQSLMRISYAVFCLKKKIDLSSQ